MADAPLPIIRIDSPDSTEKVSFPVRSRTDPTGSPPEYAVVPVERTDNGASPEDAEFSAGAGTWVVTFDTVRRVAWAETPTIGPDGTATIGVAEGEQYVLFQRIIFSGTYRPISRVATIVVAG